MIRCYYHANCTDGIAAAWVIKKHFERQTSVELIPAEYQKTKLDYNIGINDKIIIVDFSFSEQELDEAYNILGNRLLVLDHHKTSEFLKNKPYGNLWNDQESGAGIAARYTSMLPGANIKVPDLILYIEDNDLWKFKLPQSKEVNTYIQSFEPTIESIDYLYTISWETMAHIGRQLLRQKDTFIKRALSSAHKITILGKEVLAVNSPLLQSEIGNELAKMNSPYGVCYYTTHDNKISLSFRSIDSKEDVSLIAKHFGGGGHRNAAGAVINSLEDLK